MTTETIDRLPHGWIVVDICKLKPRSREWVALIAEADPRDVPHARAAWVQIPGAASEPAGCVGRAGGRPRHTPLNEKPTGGRRRAIGDANRRVMKRRDPSR